MVVLQESAPASPRRLLRLGVGRALEALSGNTTAMTTCPWGPSQLRLILPFHPWDPWPCHPDASRTPVAPALKLIQEERRHPDFFKFHVRLKQKVEVQDGKVAQQGFCV